MLLLPELDVPLMMITLPGMMGKEKRERRRSRFIHYQRLLAATLLCGCLFRRRLLFGLSLATGRGSDLVELLHEAALAARGVALMDGAFLRGTVERADRSHHGLFGISALCQRSVCTLDGSPGGAAKVAIAQSALLVLTISFDLGLDVCQGRSSK